MNSHNKSQTSHNAASSFHNHDFDFGLGPAFSKPSSSNSLNAQKSGSAFPSPASGSASWSQQKPGSASSSAWTWSSTTSSSTSTSSSAASWTWQNSSSGPRSMVGDITGKSWGVTDAAKSSLVGGLNRGASADLFGDLVGASQNHPSAPLNKQPKHQPPSSKPSSFPSSMQSMATSLPKVVPLKDMKVAKSTVANETSGSMSATSTDKGTTSSQNDGWGAFESFGSFTSASASQTKVTQSSGDPDDPFGDFQGVSSASAATNVDPFEASSRINASGNSSKDASASNDFFSFQSYQSSSGPASKASPSQTNVSDPFSFLNINKATVSQPGSSAEDPFDSLFGKPKPVKPAMDSLFTSAKPQTNVSPSTSTKTQSDAYPFTSTKTQANAPAPTQNIADDWGFEDNFGADDSAGTTTELSELPAPPAGVSGALAKDKGLEYYKQGQFADAIKWLSWAESLFEKSGGGHQLIEVLTCRFSCLKEAGEYKKAVADCSKIIELDKDNTNIMLQRALLYESMEKYKLGMADIKEVLKREPQNRVANNTFSRLKKMGD